MDQEVLDNEPHIALFWWEKTGFEMYEKLIWEIYELKKIYHFDSIQVFIEIGFDQYEYSHKYLSQKWLKWYFYFLRLIYLELSFHFLESLANRPNMPRELTLVTTQ